MSRPQTPLRLHTESAAGFSDDRQLPIDSGDRQIADFRRTTLLWFGLILAVAIVPTTLTDVPLARWIDDYAWPSWVVRLLDATRFYGTVGGLAVILLFLGFILRRRRWTIPRIASMAAGGGAVATIAKLFVLRPRPNALPIDSSAYDYAWIWSFDPTLSRVASFEPAMRAFPSATLAMATALTAGLWVVVPRLRWVGLICCLGTMLHRLQCNAHFVSDLLGSAAIGLWWAYICFHPKLMGGLFDRFEDVPAEPEDAPEQRRVRRAA